MRYYLVICVLVTVAIGSRAGLADSGLQPVTNSLRLEVFVRDDLPYCRAAAQYAEELARQRQGLCVTVHHVDESKESLTRFWQLVRKHKIDKAGLPAFFACDQFVLGSRHDKVNKSRIENLFTVTVFGRHDCPRCRSAKQFLSKLELRWPAVRMEFLDVVAEPAARRQMDDTARRYGKTVTGLPLIVCGGRALVGYQGDATTGRQLEDILKAAMHCEQATMPQSRALTRPSWDAMSPQMAVFGLLELATTDKDDLLEPLPLPAELPENDEMPDVPRVADSPRDASSAQIELPWFGTVRVSDWGMPLFTLIVGLVDGFNPCAMWVLVFLLSVLVNIKNRAKIFAIAGTFVVVSGLAYFAFMAAWLNMFLLLGAVRPLQIALGCVALFVGIVNIKDFFAFKRGLTLSIPESAKPHIFARVRQIVAADFLPLAVGLAVVLAIAVNTVELLCTAGLPALYTEILSLQALPTWENYGYLALYNLAYMFDDTVLLFTFIITLSHRKLQEREGRWMKFVSGVAILLLGLVMLLKPEWLHASAG